MSLFSRILSIGRLKAAPRGHVAGRALAPQSVQRHALSLREVDLPAGILTLRNGELRAILEVSGVPVHHASQQAAHAFLQGWARAVQAGPAEATWLMRSRPGVLASYLRERRDQAAALATRAPGSALALLAADQLANLRALGASGDVRETRPYVALRSPSGNRAALLANIDATQRHLAAAGLRATLVRDRRLAEAIAWSWRPEVPETWDYDVGTVRLTLRGHTATVGRVPTPSNNGHAPRLNGTAQKALRG